MRGAPHSGSARLISRINGRKGCSKMSEMVGGTRPMPDCRLSVAFATDPEFVLRNTLSSETTWFTRVLRTQHNVSRLDRYCFIFGSLTVRLAPSFLLNPVAGIKWLAVGDAAVT